MRLSKTFALTLISTALLGGAALAGGHGGNPAVKARQAHMQLFAHNLGVLGGMARGNTEYNAELASAAASNLAALTKLNQMSYWAPGTDSESLPGETRALPALWESIPDAMSKVQELSVAADALAASAGDGLDAVRAGLGPVGQACGACHEAYQLPNN